MDFFLKPAMNGEKPFMCYVCGQMLITDITGEYTMKLNCRRCKTEITLKTRDVLPNALVVKHGELVKL